MSEHYSYSRILQQAEKIVKKDKRVGKDCREFCTSYILLQSKDGFHLTISESAEQIDGPLYLSDNGGGYFGDYVDITRWIDRHEKYLGGKT